MQVASICEGWPDGAVFDKEFQTDIVHHDRSRDGEQVAEQLRARRDRRTAEGHVAVEPESRKEGEREGNEHGGDVCRHGHEAQIDQLFVDQKIIDQKITSPPEHDIRAPADGVAEHLPGYDRGNGPQIEQVDRPDDPIGKTHQRAV